MATYSAGSSKGTRPQERETYRYAASSYREKPNEGEALPWLVHAAYFGGVREGGTYQEYMNLRGTHKLLV